MGLRIERDKWFRPVPVTQLPEYREKWGNDGPYGGSTPTSAKQLTGESAEALLTKVAAIVPEMSGIDDVQPSPSPLPEGWTVEDIALLLEKLEGGPILVADTELDLPTIHNTGGRIEHCGFGLMKSEGTGFTLHFDAGSAMKRTPSGKGWTRLKVEGQYAYDMEGVKATLQAYATADDSENEVGLHPLTFGDNGGQVFFEGEEYLLLNPYLEREGERYGTGWTWHYRNGSTGNEWRCLPDPDAGPDTCIGAFSLKEAVAYAERVTGLHFNLVGTPADLPDSYPIHEMWKEHQARKAKTEVRPSVCDNASRGPSGWKGGVSPTPGGVSITPQCLDSPAARVVTVYYDEYMDDGEHDTMNLCDECYRILRKEARAHGYKVRSKKLSAARPKAKAEAKPKAKAKEPTIQVVEPAPPPAQAEATAWEPTPEDEAEFKQWSLELLTGMMKKRKSAFYRALDAVARPGALRLALIEIPAAEARRCELIEKRLAKLAA